MQPGGEHREHSKHLPSMRKIWTFSLFIFMKFVDCFFQKDNFITYLLIVSTAFEENEMLFFVSSWAFSSQWPDASAEYFQRTQVFVEKVFLFCIIINNYEVQEKQEEVLSALQW